MALWEEKFLLNLRDSTQTDSHGKRYKTAASGKGIRKGLAGKGDIEEERNKGEIDGIGHGELKSEVDRALDGNK